MQARMKRRVAAATSVCAAGVMVLAGAVPAAAAKTPNPCKILKATEISQEFDGATVSDPEPGLKTAASTSCTWDVAAGTTLPDGSVTTTIMFFGGKPAYNGLKKEAGFVPVAGLKSSLYQESTGALMVLDGANLVTVQGVFLAVSPIRHVDVQEHLIPLSKLATKRV
jgi:hypothetical protein